MDKKDSSRWNNFLVVLRKSRFVIFFSSLFWFLYKTGTKPSRIRYPCQQAALANMGAILKFSAIPFLGLLFTGPKGRKQLKRYVKAILIVSLLFLITLIVFEGYSSFQEKKKMQKIVIPEDVYSDIFLVTDTDGTSPGVERLIGLMEGNGLDFYKTAAAEDGLIGKDDVVLLKVNSQWDERGGTNTDLVKSVIEAVISHPEGFSGEIVVVDNGQAQYGAKMTGGSFVWENNNAINRTQSIQDVVDMYKGKYKVSTYLWDNITTKVVAEFSEGDFEDGFVLYDLEDKNREILKTISYPKFKTEYGTYISFKKGIWDTSEGDYDNANIKLINMPVLKPHLIYGVTGAVKNYMGTPSDKLTKTEAHNSIGNGGMGVQMAETRFPSLTIMDSIWVSTVYPCTLATWWCGPNVFYNDSLQNNMVLAGTDPVALDYWVSKNILMKTSKELGHENTKELDPDLTKRGSFGYWLRISMDVLNKAGYSTTIREENIRVISS
ncbi:DUF362 domain-containing protein [Candidatus Woesearchaeota archaeon]|nr:DUF362 domain-containing protein [Candidatus Woesearchaeota archaeon]